MPYVNKAAKQSMILPLSLVIGRCKEKFGYLLSSLRLHAPIDITSHFAPSRGESACVEDNALVSLSLADMIGWAISL